MCSSGLLLPRQMKGMVCSRLCAADFVQRRSRAVMAAVTPPLTNTHQTLSWRAASSIHGSFSRDLVKQKHIISAPCWRLDAAPPPSASVQTGSAFFFWGQIRVCGFSLRSVGSTVTKAAVRKSPASQTSQCQVLQRVKGLWSEN